MNLLPGAGNSGTAWLRLELTSEIDKEGGEN